MNNRQKEIESLNAQKDDIDKKIERLNTVTKYGYCRVSTKGQAREGTSLESQEESVKAAGAEIIYKEAYTGTKRHRPEFDKLMNELHEGDTLIVTKLDRIARSASQGIEVIDELWHRGVKINILNMGVIDDSPTGRLIRTIFMGFAEFERDMIVERTSEGKEIARQDPDFKDGRPPKYSQERIDLALKMLETTSYRKTARQTGISVSTLQRIKNNK